MSQRALSQTLFHGTATPLSGAVLPANEHGQGSRWGDSIGEYARANAFATTDERQAWHFAEESKKLHPGRVHIYEVGHHPEMKPGMHSELSEYVAPRFPIKQRIDIKPGRQGTLPGIDWNTHQSARNVPYGTRMDADANHPEPEIHSSAGATNAGEIHPLQNLAIKQFAAQRAAGPGQGELFNAPQPTLLNDRAKHHSLSHVVRSGVAPAYGLDHTALRRETETSQLLRDSARNLPRWGG